MALAFFECQMGGVARAPGEYISQTRQTGLEYC